MTHRFPIKEIARQSGLGTATVDRVLNNRAHVSPQTRNRVAAAVDELERQEKQLSARGRRLFVDFVVEAPDRFSREIRRTAEAVLPSLGPGVFRPRFIFQELMEGDEIATILRRIIKRGSDGVCLKARDVPAARDMVDKLEAAGIPVITLVTDIPQSGRTAYVGLNNGNAGETAAYLLASILREGTGSVLAMRSQESFFGETERFAEFRDSLRRWKPNLDIIDVSGGGGIPSHTTRQLASILPEIENVSAVYSMGGGNRAVLSLLAEYGFRNVPYIAHDLDEENRHLLSAGAIDYVLHHDLGSDMRNMFLAMAARHGLAAPQPERTTSDIQIITPYNLPDDRKPALAANRQDA